MEVTSIAFLPIFARKERSAFEALKEHATAVLDVVKKFEEAVAAFSAGDIARLNALGDELDRLESDVDGMRRKFEAGLAGGAFLPAFRGDLARLCEMVDDVADMAQEAARGIRWRARLLDALAEAEGREQGARSIREGLSSLAAIAVKAAEALRGAVDSLTTNIDAAAMRAQEVERLEHDSDLIEEKTIRDIYAHEDLLDPVSVMQLRLIVELIGGISDCAEDAGDLVSAISYTIRA